LCIRYRRNKFRAQWQSHEGFESFSRSAITTEDLSYTKYDGELEVKTIRFVRFLDEALKGEGGLDAFCDFTHIGENVIKALAASKANASITVST